MPIDLKSGLKGPWLKTEAGDWINSAHIDFFEARSAKQKSDGEKPWQVVAWNALQAQVDAYVLSSYKNESDARKDLDKLIGALAP